ncbi:MAG: purine-binding chemotaxis protein CheW [Cyanobacteria bacterium NC_groundwater_1444_Ag_S-0.65um_54_12]|nr:purine-binding chemotaxis protein CheW [Cyanobacteria bacterium NC_groundwater_1444_Ag_S-0.65um_54_12]
MAEELQVVTFSLAAETYGISISEVQEIIPLLPIIRVPEALPWIEGLVDLRGSVLLPVVDLRRRFGLPRLEQVSTKCIIVVNIANQGVGLMVDAVRDVARVPIEVISPVPAAVGARACFLQGIARVAEDNGHRILLLLELEQLLSGKEVTELETLGQ